MKINIRFNKPIFGQISRPILCESYNMTDHAIEILYNNDEFELIPYHIIESIHFPPKLIPMECCTNEAKKQ